MAEEKKDLEQAGEEQAQRLNQEEEMSPEGEDTAPRKAGDAPVSPEDEETSPSNETAEPEDVPPGEEVTADVDLEDELQQRITALESEKNELTNRLLRLQADFDNYRKRVRAEKEELTQYANFNLIQKLLPVIDNMERACSASENSSEGVLEGLEMIKKNMLDILAKEGVTPIECKGKPFDPNCHEAAMTEKSQDYPANTVLEEFQKGYMMNDRVLRASMVKVSTE